MASKPTTNQPHGTYSTPIVQPQGVYMMPVQPLSTPRIIRPVPGVLCLSISTIVLASLLIILGIVAVILKARHSYVGNPIWTGLFFLLTTGILGIFVYKKRNSLCMNISFMVMAIISSVFAYQLFVYGMQSVSDENGYECLPGANWERYYYNCSPLVARVVIGVAIVLCALASLVLCIISWSMTIYGTFRCCYNCCSCCRNTTDSHPTVQYSPHLGAQLAPMNAHAMQVMASTPQTIPQQVGSQPLLVPSPQSFTPTAPPAYIAVANVNLTPPQASMAPGNQQFAPGTNYAAPENADLGSAQVAGGQALAVNSGNAPQTSNSGQVADNPQNWQKF